MQKVAGAAGRDANSIAEELCGVIGGRIGAVYSTGDEVSGLGEYERCGSGFLATSGRVQLSPEALIHILDSGSLCDIPGDFALALARPGEVVLARDPVGTHPLYYRLDNGIFTFSSERRALDKPQPVKPGHIVRYSGGHIRDVHSCGLTAGAPLTGEARAVNAIEPLLKKAVDTLVSGSGSCGLAFSGGLDSSLLAVLSRAPLYSVSVEGAHDAAHTANAAGLLGISDRLHSMTVSLESLEKSLHYVVKLLGSANPLSVSIGLPVYLVNLFAHENGVELLLSGQGADELFGGYKRYESLSGNALAGALKRDVSNIAETNIERDYVLASACDVEPGMPYLDREVVTAALGISPDLKVREIDGKRIRKYILRKLALKYMLPELAWKDKKAVQYSSGVQAALERLARKYAGKERGYLRRYLESLL